MVTLPNGVDINNLIEDLKNYSWQAADILLDYSEKINSTRITKVSYLLKLKAQRNSISDLDEKHKAWGQKEVMSKETSYEITL